MRMLRILHRNCVSRIACIFVIMSVTAAMLSSCGSGFMRKYYNDYSVDPLEHDTSKTISRELAGTCTLDSEKKPTVLPDGKAICGYCLDGKKLDNDQKDLCSYQRNLVIGDLIGISDTMCDTHIRTIYGNEASLNIITGTFTNAFSGAATVVGGEGSKSILSALAFFFNSERSLMNETVYKSVLVPAIVKKINESRQASRKNIFQKYETNKNEDYEKYPVNIALLDVIEYHQTCSFMSGLQKALYEGIQNTKERDMGFLEQKRTLLTLQYDARIKELKDSKNINEDPTAKGLKSQIESINEQIIQLQKQGVLTSQTQGTTQELTFTGQVTAINPTDKTIKVKDASGEKIFNASDAAVLNNINTNDTVTINYVVEKDKNVVKKIVKKDSD